jgi:hypothetical protein
MQVNKMPILPQVVLWTAGVVGAFVLARIIRREYERVNEELEAIRVPVNSKADRARHPTLRRDSDGVYRP